MDKKENLSEEDEGFQQETRNVHQDSPASPINSDSSSSSSSSSQDEKRQRVASPLGGFFVSGMPASPPKFVSLEQIMKAANGVSNMVLCHEIAVDKDFKLEKVEPPDHSLHKQVKEIIHQAFWDVLRDQLKEEPPKYTQAMVLLAEIKEGLTSMLMPQHTKLRSQINEVLDLELIKQQVEHEALDFHYYAHYIVSVMGRICAPVRDDKIRELTATTDVVPLFKGILETIDLMKVDMANFTIQQFRPLIQQQSIEYERKKFQEFLETQTDGLQFTKLWLRQTFEKFCESQDLNGNRSAAVPKILTNAYVDLLVWKGQQMMPETLLIDQSRFLNLRDKVSMATLVGSVVLVTLSTVGPALQGLAEFKDTLKQHLHVLLEGVAIDSEVELQARLPNVAEQVVKEVNSALEKHGFPVLNESKAEAVRGQVQGIVSPDHSVRKLIRSRILEFIEQAISSSTASPIKIPPGLSVLQSELAHVTGQFLRLVAHNRAVFFEHYSDIITSFLQESCKEEKSPNVSLTDSGVAL